MDSHAPQGHGREAIISVRLSPVEEEQIKTAAEQRGEPVSAFVREAALKVARPSRNSGPFWSSSAATVATTGTVLPQYFGTVSISSPANATEGTTGTAAEPIDRSS